MKSLVSVLLSILIAGCSTVAPSDPPHRARQLPRDPRTYVSVGTYNIYVGARDLRATAEVIRRMDADVIALQEVRPASAASLEKAFSLRYRYRYFADGLGLMSQFPLRNPRFERSRHGINGFMFAEIHHPAGRLQLVNMHLDPLHVWTPQGVLSLPIQVLRHGQIHRAEIAQALNHLRVDLPTVLLGDLNCTSNAPIRRLRELGYIDSAAVVVAKPNRIPTIHVGLLGLRLGRRIDFIFHNRDFGTVNNWVLRGRPSDHDAVVSVLRRQARPVVPR